ncbi:MAG: hypothetical protein JO106_18360 [Mycobacterium sp.]|nr:hypothetical protein [Mycobacterium sp.]
MAALIVAPALARADGPSDEQKFLAAAHRLPAYVLPQGDRSTDADILAGGYQACAVLNQYPTDSMRAARVYFHGGNTVNGEITYDGQMFMTYASRISVQSALATVRETSESTVSAAVPAASTV